MANNKTWEERIAHARAVNAAKQSAGVNNAPAVKTVSASSGLTKSWDDRIAHAKKVNAEKQRAEYEAYIKTDEYKWASENEKRLKSGLGYNVNNGQIYSFDPITRDSLQKSIAWADNEIKKLKEKGGHSTKVGEWTDKLLTYAGYGDKKKDRISEAEEIAEASARLRELEGQRAVYSKYLENLQVKEDVEKLDSDIYAKNKIGAIFNIDNEQKLYFLNAGEDGYDNDTYYNNSVKRDKLVKELQSMGYDDVDRYIESYAKSRNEETFAPILEYIEKGIVKHPVLGAAATTAINAVTAPIQGVGQAFDSIAEAVGIHGYSAASLPGMVSDLSKTTVHKVIDKNIDNTFLNKLSKVAYNVATNIVENSYVNKTFDKLSEGVLGLNAAASTYKDGKSRGLSDGQALASGIAAGIFETLFEHLSLEKLRAFQASPSTTLKPFIKNVLKQSFTEGMEEFGTDIANEAYDYFVNGGLSQYEQALRSGVTPKEYGQQFLAQLGETFVTGALAGGGMIGMSTAPTAVRGSVAQVLTDKAVGSKIRSEDEFEKTISAAKEQGGMLSKKAAKIEKQIKDGESVSDRKIGQIDRKTTKIERAKAVDTILAGDEYKGISDKEKKAIRSSVLTFLSSGGQVAYEQKQVLDTENGRKALEAAQKWEIDKVLEIGNERIERRSTNIRKAVEEHNTESLVKNTFSAVNAEGYKVTAGAVRSITDGEFEIIQDNETGATAKLSELKIEDRQARELYKNLQELATGENPLTVDAVNVALSMYNTLDNTSARAYSLWVHDAYKAGSVSIKNTVLSFPEFEEMFHKKYDGDIKEQQLREIYEIGARNLKVKPGVTRVGRKGLSKFQAEQVFVLHERAKELGLEIVLVDGKLTDKNGRGVNALYIEGTNRIVMSLQSDLNLTLVHAGHEIFHWAKNQNKEMSQYLQDRVVGVLKSDSKYDFDGIYKQISAEYDGLSEDAILEEIAAQYLGVVFANEDSIRKTVATATAEQKSFLKRMVDYLKDFIKSLKKLIDLYGDSDKTVRAAVTTPTDQLADIARQFEIALNEAAKKEKPATETGGVKASRKIETKTNSFSHQLNDWKEGFGKPFGSYNGHFFRLGKTSDVLMKHGAKDAELIMYTDCLLKITGNKHSISLEELAKIPEQLNDPILLFRGSVPNSFVALTEIVDKSENDVIVAVHINKKHNRNVINKIASVYSKSDETGNNKIASYVERQIEEGNLIDASTKKAPIWFTTKGLQLPEVVQTIISTNNTVSQNTQSVNNNSMQDDKKNTTKYSVKIDTEGNKFVDVDPVLFDARDGESHARTIARIIKDRFNNLISVNGQQIQINKTTNDEWRRSNGADALRNRDLQGYFDKLKTIPYADEILKAAKNWIGEELHHPRKDDISEFARGNVYYRVGNNGYVADVIVAIRKNGTAVLYDLDDIRAKKITDVSLTMASESPQRSAETSVTDNISQSTSAVNTKFSRQLLDFVEDSVDQLKAENYSFGEYVDKLTAEINAKISGKRSPGSSTIFNREEFINIAKKYNTFYKKNENGGYNQLRYSDSEIANAIERVLVGISEGVIDAKKGVTLLARMQVDILSDGYVIEDEARAKEFRQFVRNKPINLSPRDFAELVDAHGGSKKTLRAASFHQLSFKEAEDGQRADIGVFYETARKLFPEFLKEVITPIEMAEELINAEKSLRPTVHYASEQLGFSGELEMREAAIRRAADILREAFNAQTVQGDFTEQYKELIAARKSYDKLRQYNKKLLENASKSYYEVEKKETTYKRIIRNAKRLDDMLRNETDTRHIPENLKTPVAKLLSIIAPFTEKRSGKSKYNAALTVRDLMEAYEEYGIEDGVHFDEDIENQIKKLQYILVGDVDIKKMSFEALAVIDDVVKHFSHLVKTGNEMFVNGRREKFASWANESMEEMENHRKLPEYKTQKKILDAEQGMLTPIYFFKTIGTTTKNGTVYEERLFKMFRDLQDGQDKWYRNIADVKKELAEIKAKYHYSEDWKRETTEFTLASGETIKLTAEEIMYMRALNIRETGHVNRLCHLLEGGIIVENDGRLRKFAEKKQSFEETKQERKAIKENGGFSEKDITKALKKNLTREDLISIFATLTEEQELYSEALVEMLSTTGADLGNAVSRELFGIDKFKEKNYIPISVAESFLQFSVDKKAGGNIRLKNRSFTKRTTENANAAVYVRSITDIAAEHLQEMSLYNAMTIPIENLTRVFNYQKPVQEEFDAEGNVKETTGNSYKEIFEDVYGERGIKYFKDFLRDMNGGNQIPSRDFMSKMMSMYKKSAVTGSLSVAIQQPSAIARTTALIDPKYFVTKPYSKEDYLEMLEYCPVAGIKEIGRFDTGTGLTATEWILDENGGFKDKADALLSYLPGWMDRRTWVYIWEAVKKETAEKTHKTGEELLEAAAKRFRDIIDYTQVYDSTLSRSAYMRDKGTGAKMATAFMAEPTLSYNLLRDGAINAKNDKKQMLRNVGAFTTATLLNTFLKSFITALRKDDEETNYGEVYLDEAISNIISDIDPINMLPVIKDIVNIVKGYDVSRPDMTLIQNLVNSGRVISNKLSKGKIPTFEECLTLVGTVTAFTGVPLNNVFKEFFAVLGTVQGFGKSPGFSLKEVFTFKNTSDSVRLYRAILRKDEDAIERYMTVDEETVKEYRRQGYSEADAYNKALDNAENNFHSKVISGLVSEDIRIKEAAEARLESDTKAYEELLDELTREGFDRNDVIKAVEKYISSMEDKTYESSEPKDKFAYAYVDLFNAINADKMSDAKHIFDKLAENVQKETVQENIRDEYAGAVYQAIIRKNKAEKERYEKIFEEFDYDYHYAVILGLKENDLRISEAAEARYNGENAEYESIKADIVADGFDENDVFNAIESETEKLAPDEEKEESHPEDSYLYEPADLKRYAKAYQFESTKKAIQDFRDSGKEDGDIRRSLTDAFKPQYIEAWRTGDYTEIDKIRNFLESLNVGYKSSSFTAWEKEANNKE